MLARSLASSPRQRLPKTTAFLKRHMSSSRLKLKKQRRSLLPDLHALNDDETNGMTRSVQPFPSFSASNRARASSRSMRFSSPGTRQTAAVKRRHMRSPGLTAKSVQARRNRDKSNPVKKKASANRSKETEPETVNLADSTSPCAPAEQLLELSDDSEYHNILKRKTSPVLSNSNETKRRCPTKSGQSRRGYSSAHRRPVSDVEIEDSNRIELPSNVKAKRLCDKKTAEKAHDAEDSIEPQPRLRNNAKSNRRHAAKPAKKTRSASSSRSAQRAVYESADSAETRAFESPSDSLSTSHIKTRSRRSQGPIVIISDDERSVPELNSNAPSVRNRMRRTKEPEKLMAVPVNHEEFSSISELRSRKGLVADLEARRPAKYSRSKTKAERMASRTSRHEPKDVREKRCNRFETNLDQSPLSHEKKQSGSLKTYNHLAMKRAARLKRANPPASAGMLSSKHFERTSSAKSTPRHYSVQRGTDSDASTEDERLVPLNRPGELKLWMSHTMKQGINGVPLVSVAVKIPSANITLKRDDFMRLRGSRWLNDELVNAFAGLLNERSMELDEAAADEPVEAVPSSSKLPSHGGKDHDALFARPRPRTRMFNSFFYHRLAECGYGYDYSGVRRWSKRASIDVANLDLILVPVNVGNMHWVLVAIDIRARELVYLDSLGGRGAAARKVLNTLKQWLGDEMADKYGDDAADELCLSTWKLVINPGYLPHQTDGGSCGVFVLYCADYLALGRKPAFTQQNIDNLRKRTCIFLVRKHLADRLAPSLHTSPSPTQRTQRTPTSV